METQSPALNPAQYVNTAAAGRDCGTCTLCCKVFDVPSLNKPAGKWCTHCSPGKGCGIHETRPDHCRSFFCMWMTVDWLGPEWKPEIAKFVLTIDPVSKFMLVQVDPGSPKAWREKPYYAQFQHWARAMMPREQLVVILNGNRATVVMPDGETELGVIGPQDRLGVKMRMTPNGPTYDLQRTKAGV
jgi:hypothetical protein